MMRGSKREDVKIKTNNIISLNTVNHKDNDIGWKKNKRMFLIYRCRQKVRETRERINFRLKTKYKQIMHLHTRLLFHSSFAMEKGTER